MPARPVTAKERTWKQLIRARRALNRARLHALEDDQLVLAAELKECLVLLEKAQLSVGRARFAVSAPARSCK